MRTSREIREIRARETLGIRHLVLRPNQAPEHCIYPGDDVPPTGHYGAFVGGKLVGIASVYPEAHPHEPGRKGGWRLRGMATLPESRGMGLGAELVAACMEHVRRNGGAVLWCNARTPACGFYRKLGFTERGEEFEIVPIGPHYVMDRKVGARAT